MKGNKAKRIVIPFGPDHQDFKRYYDAAREGVSLDKENPRPEQLYNKQTYGLLQAEYIDWLSDMVKAGRSSPYTLKQRKSQLGRVGLFEDISGQKYNDLHLDLPQSAFMAVKDAMAKTPSEADNTIKSLKALYKWAVERGKASVNPVEGIGKYNVYKGGAIPWTPKDFEQFKEQHPIGTTPYLWLTLDAFTCCRIGDARILGPEHRNGKYLEWQPGKKGSVFRYAEILSPLQDAMDSMVVVGKSYILNQKAQPYASTNSLVNTVRTWCNDAGLDHLSSHGIRKGLGSYLHTQGVPQNAIAALLSHANVRTTQTYTSHADRRALSDMAARELLQIKW